MSLFLVNCEGTVLFFFVKRDLDPPLYHPQKTAKTLNLQVLEVRFQVLIDI